MKMPAVLFAALALTGCAHTPPELAVRTVTVKVPVPVPCKARVAAKPRYADQDAATAADIFEQVRALLKGIEQRAERETNLESAVESCGGSVK